MADAVWAGQFFEDEEGLYVPAGGGKVKMRPAEKGVGRDKWEDELLHYVAYFPVTRQNASGGAGTASYRLEMKLPGFAALPGPWYVDKDCGCPPEKTGKEPTCFAAWVGPDGYPQATDAWKAYLSLLPLLDELSDYRPVHGDGPGEYGIGLYNPEEIVASGAQDYAYPEMAARAMGRAKDCINMEGIDLVEHLLLRPGKGTTKAIPVCQTSGDAGMVFRQGAGTGLPLQPGADGYSFIATAFLPAWPQRFRKKENRQLLETLLQQETPAHILLRILWLTPVDMCRWESMYKDWLRSLVPEKPCGDFKTEDWVRLLFEVAPNCLAECGECGETVDAGSGAAGEVAAEGGGKTSDSDEWLSEINLLYCWKDRVCADTSGWKFDTPVTNPQGGGIQFKTVPKPVVKAGNSGGGVVRGAEAKGKEDMRQTAVGKQPTAGDKLQVAADKVKAATDKVHESLLDRLKRLIERQRKK
jgi:hypothetical protein